jgi:hypothetical protein
VHVTGAERRAASAQLAGTVAKSRAPIAGTRVSGLDPKLQQAAAASGAGRVSVEVEGATAQLASAVAKVGGETVATVPGAVSAVVPSGSLVALARSAGVSGVRRPDQAYDDGTISQGVAAANANTWQGAGQNGAGVKIGIVDAGFGGLAAEVTAGNLPAGQTVMTPHCANVNGSNHGTAVAEIVHQMAPAATLYLECIDDNVEFQAAEGELQAAGVKIVNSSLAFAGDSRGDGTGDPTSTATTVKTARQAGILWVQSAGNEGIDHTGGNLNSDADGFVTLPPVGGASYDTDVIGVDPEASGIVSLQWDQWPTSSLGLSLVVGQLDAAGNVTGTPTVVSQAAGTSPVLQTCFAPGGGGGCINTSILPSGGAAYVILIEAPPGVPALRYDLSYLGNVSPNIESCATFNAGGYCTAYATSPESIAEPASSPYAFAAGAADVVTGGVNGGSCGADAAPVNGAGGYRIEDYSSQGPTIDGRVKPDILGYDGTSSNLNIDGSGTVFCGTSAAAPSVAGAAAVLLGANPSLDASQLQAYLEQHSNGGAPDNPPTDQTGHGALNLGAVSTPQAPVGAGYVALSTPVRVLDTRSDGGPLATGSSRTVSLAAVVPAGATAVAVNLTGVLSGTGAGVLELYPGGEADPGTSNLNLQSPADGTAAAFSVVTLGSGNSIIVHSFAGSGPTSAILDVLGYFTPSAGGDYGALAPSRLLDTRTSIGNHQGELSNGQSVTITPAGLPAGTTSVVVNVTAADSTGPGWFTLTPGVGVGTTSTINYDGFDRANLAVVALQGGSFTLHAASASADAIVDLVGYFGSSGPSRYVALPAPTRVVDTRTGNGGELGALAAGAKDVVAPAGLDGVPNGATAVLTGVVAVPTGSGYLTVYPANLSTPPPVSTVNFTPGRNVANAAVVNLTGSPGSSIIFNDSGRTDVVMDLFGYFD